MNGNGSRVRHTKENPKAPRRIRSKRPRKVSLVRCLLLACMIAASMRLFAANPITLDIEIRSLQDAEVPRLVDDVLIFSLKPEPVARHVAARFAHENFTVLHTYTRNQNGVFVLDYPVPEGVREFRYRIVVDGLWMSDPSNPTVETDALGNEMSVFTLDKDPPRPVSNPRARPDGAVSFTFRGDPGKRVAIVGDFNNWDPFMDYLQETSAGLYAITLRARPGDHWYYFFSDGRKILDVFNTETGVDPDGNTVSYFRLAP